MKITEHIYQVSGNSFGTNSSNYIVDAGKELVLFDAGYSDYQMEIMERTMRYWGIGEKPIRHVFLTHVHMDHAANAAAFQEKGAKIYIGERDADTLEQGGPELLEVLFGRKFKTCRADIRLRDGDEFVYGGVTVKCIALPGHTPGSMGFLADDSGTKCLITGDFIAVSAVEPDESAQQVLLAAMIRPGFLEEAYGESLQKACGLTADILLPGHLLPYFGDPAGLFRKAYHKFMTEKHDILDTTKL